MSTKKNLQLDPLWCAGSWASQMADIDRQMWPKEAAARLALAELEQLLWYLDEWRNAVKDEIAKRDRPGC